MSSSGCDRPDNAKRPSSPDSSHEGTNYHSGSDVTSLFQQQISLLTPVSSESGSQTGHDHFLQDRGRTAVEECPDVSGTHNLGALELDPRHASTAVVEKVTRVAVQEFWSSRKLSSAKRPAKPCAHRSRKRLRPGSRRASATSVSCSDTEDSDSVLVEKPMATESGIWPCPFFVKDRKAYASCLTRHCLLSLNDVREHLYLMHQIPTYCSVCYDTFSTVRLRDDHMGRRECDYQRPKAFDGITDAQLRALEEQVDTEDKILESQRSQWLRFWHIIFPNDDLPPSPLSFTSQELKVYELRRFWNRTGEKITSEVLEPQELQEWVNGNGERDLGTLYSLVSDCAADELLKLL